VVEHFANLASVKFEVRMREVDKGYSSSKDQHPGVITLPLRLKGVVAQFIAVRRIVDIMFLFKTVTMRIGRKDVLVTKIQIITGYLTEEGEGRCGGGSSYLARKLRWSWP